MTPEDRVRLILAAGAAAAYGSPALDPPSVPCTVCGTAEPAADPAECYHPDTCPLEGRP